MHNACFVVEATVRIPVDHQAVIPVRRVVDRMLTHRSFFNVQRSNVASRTPRDVLMLHPPIPFDDPHYRQLARDLTLALLFPPAAEVGPNDLHFLIKEERVNEARSPGYEDL